MSKRRVVVTGLGLITPVGIGVSETWKNIIAGKSGITTISKFDTSNFSSQIAGEVKNFDPLQYLNAKEARRMDTFIQYGIAAGIEAINDSGFEIDEKRLNKPVGHDVRSTKSEPVASRSLGGVEPGDR